MIRHAADFEKFTAFGPDDSADVLVEVFLDRF
jgi:hypothetical protein